MPGECDRWEADQSAVTMQVLPDAFRGGLVERGGARSGNRWPRLVANDSLLAG